VWRRVRTFMAWGAGGLRARQGQTRLAVPGSRACMYVGMYVCMCMRAGGRACEAALASERLRSQDGNRRAGLGVLGPRGEQLEEMSCGFAGGRARSDVQCRRGEGR
jgi:hypothetical protein